MERSTKKSQATRTGSYRDQGQTSDVEPEPDEAQTAAVCTGLYNAFKSDLSQYLAS